MYITIEEEDKEIFWGLGDGSTGHLAWVPRFERLKGAKDFVKVAQRVAK